ncbi:MAG TPA: TOBE domain-containing protein [Acidimicrobiales bacterium]|nr:TOBE domain-containing protein [Acidimicrobiales bacterium]
MASESASTAASPRRAESARRLGCGDLSLGERVCLALIDEGVDHGWAIGTELAPDGELGRVWTLSRPLTYRAVEQLESKGIVRRKGPRRGGRERTLLSCTAHGRRVAREWLDAPVEHLRDVRTELLLKVLLRRRRGLATEPLLQAQQQAFGDHIDTLTTVGAAADPVDLWRRESARAVRRFLDAALAVMTQPQRTEELPLMRLSARNQLRARVTSVVHGGVMSTVKTVLADGQTVTAVITRESAQDLDLAPDDDVLVIVKSTEVMLAKP